MYNFERDCYFVSLSMPPCLPACENSTAAFVDLSWMRFTVAAQFMVGWAAAGLLAVVMAISMWRKKNIYLVDYTVHKPDDR
jgi:hypothetical protein